MPRLWRMVETGAITLVKNWGAVERPKQSPKLVRLAEGHKPQVLTTVQVDGDLQVRFLQIDGDHPVAQTDQQKNRLNGLHLEGSLENEAIEDREVYHGSPQPGGLPNDKHPAVKARRRKRS